MSQVHNCAGVVLSPQELAWLQSPPAPFHVRGSFCTAGTGLLGAYALTDVLMALSGMPWEYSRHAEQPSSRVAGHSQGTRQSVC